MRSLCFWVVGGDARQVFLAEELTADGHRVFSCALGLSADRPDLSGIDGADAVILPLPALRQRELNAPLARQAPALTELLDALKPGQLLLGGQLSPDLVLRAKARGLRPGDYYDREGLAVRNALITSEGAIALALEALPVTLHGARVLVLGAGRIGRCLCQQLRGLGALVTLGARRERDLAWGTVWGCDGLRSDRLSEADLSPFALVLNTVPAPLLDREALAKLGREAVILELASPPGGVDLAAARALGLRALPAPGLPGKTAPLSAARAIREALYQTLAELGVCL